MFRSKEHKIFILVQNKLVLEFKDDKKLFLVVVNGIWKTLPDLDYRYRLYEECFNFEFVKAFMDC